MEGTRKWIESHWPHGATLSATMDAAILAHAYARKNCGSPLWYAAMKVGPVLDQGGYREIQRWADDYRATGCLWLTA